MKRKLKNKRKETRCPVCGHNREINTPWQWIVHIKFEHGIGAYPDEFPLITWGQANAWYHAALLGVTP